MIRCSGCGNEYNELPYNNECIYCGASVIEKSSNNEYFYPGTPIEAFMSQADVVPKAKANDPLNNQIDGEHYKQLGDAQPWKIFPKWFTPEELRGYVKGEVIVYLCRERDKGGIKDIRKAHHVLSLYLNTLKEDDTNEDS